jgi:copper chaperone CopZ
MPTTTYTLSGLHCGACVGRVTKALAPLAESVNVTLAPMQAVITHPSADFAQLQAAVAAAGQYTLQENKPASPSSINAIATNPVAIEAPKDWLSTYYPLLLIAVYLLVASVGVQWGQHALHPTATNVGIQAITAHDTMRYFMAGFFIVFSFFKLLDIHAFANAYAGYDLLAARWHGWGLVYPFVELALGLAYLTHYNPPLTNWLTVIVMGFSAIGVVRAVLTKSQIQCACLGTVFKLPMSTVTIVEDVGMVLMAAAMLLR